MNVFFVQIYDVFFVAITFDRLYDHFELETKT